MLNYRVIIIGVLVGVMLTGSRCSPTPPQPPQPVLPEAEEPVSGPGEGEDLVGLSFVTYTNRAVGYTILRPNNWYWRHYIANEIGSINPSVVDYFITDSKPLPSLGSEYLGQIVIEVSERELADYAEAVAGLEKSVGMVGSITAQRYEGEKTNQSENKVKVVEYQFSYNKKTFRIIYTAEPSSDNEKDIFDQVVSSFKF